MQTRKTVKNFECLKQVEWIENMMADETEYWQVSLEHFKENHWNCSLYCILNWLHLRKRLSKYCTRSKETIIHEETVVEKSGS